MCAQAVQPRGGAVHAARCAHRLTAREGAAGRLLRPGAVPATAHAQVHRLLRGGEGGRAAAALERLGGRAQQMWFETAPGEQAQVDWGQVKVRLGEQPSRAHVFVMTLGYSRRGFAEGNLHHRMDSLLSAHEWAFAQLLGTHNFLSLTGRFRMLAARQTIEQENCAVLGQNPMGSLTTCRTFASILTE